MKYILITGVSRGMGKAFAEKFLSEDWKVIGTSTSGKSSIENEKLQVYRLDISSPESIEAFGQEIKKTGDKIDVLINNAGIYLGKDTFPMERNVLQKTLDVNLIGLIDLTEKIIPVINNDGGHIVNMSSGLGVNSDFVGSDTPSYRISKVGVNMFTRTLAQELKGRGITVSSFNPGWVRTDMGGADAPREPYEVAEEIYKLATSQVDSGYFWHQGKKIPW